MQVELQNLGRSFGRQVVFKALSYTFETGGSYAILGGNGSGKSTLLSILYSALSQTEGEIRWWKRGVQVPVSQVPFRCSLSGPYFELIEELTALEFLNFHQRFKPFLSGVDPKTLLAIAQLQHAEKKEIRHFSSGMKQRLKLAISLLADVDLILLDEPSSNLDPSATSWYNSLVESYKRDRTLIVGSNFNEAEMGFCAHRLDIDAYKQV